MKSPIVKLLLLFIVIGMLPFDASSMLKSGVFRALPSRLMRTVPVATTRASVVTKMLLTRNFGLQISKKFPLRLYKIDHVEYCLAS